MSNSVVQQLSHPIDTNKLPPAVMQVAQKIRTAGGLAWLVGGCVRDLLLAIPPKDYDLEVYGLDEQALQTCLRPLGPCQLVGRQFGVFKLWFNNMEIDIALPRREVKTANGHRGFDIISDPTMSPESATLRRDFTINAMMFNPLSNRLLDLHDGMSDLKSCTLCHVSPAFREDPLRPLRAMQFAARFRLTLATDTAVLCRTMLHEAATLPASRIWQEWQKWSHAPYPSFGLKALNASGWLSLYPELAAIESCPQDPRWHPEGNVWEHTLQVIDIAATIGKKNSLDARETEHLLFAALCHDLGKPATTITRDDGRISSPAHCEAGLPLTRTFLQRIHAPGRISDYTLPLVRDHITHIHGEPTARAVRRLAHRLQPAHIELWEMLVEADASGRSPALPSRPAKSWLQLAIALQHQHKPAPRIVDGAMLIKFGIKPGPDMGRILKLAYDAQLNGTFSDTSSAEAWCRSLPGTSD